MSKILRLLQTSIALTQGLHFGFFFGQILLHGQKKTQKTLVSF